MACTNSQTAASFWLKTTPADSLVPGYRVIQAEGQTRHIIPLTEWTASPETDTYHQLHHHGVAIESDKMAYRIYFDKKHTIDVYAKRSPRLELPTSYWYPSPQQLSSHYGDDILRVSGKIGVGSVKPYHNGKMIHIDSVESRTQRIVECTRKQAVMEISVNGWKTEGKKVDMTVRYTLRAGHRDMICEVFLSEPLDFLCTGVQIMPDGGTMAEERKYVSEPENARGLLLGSWGTDWPVNDTIHYKKETLGLGVYIPEEYKMGTVKDPRNNLGLFKASKYIKFYLTVVSMKEDNPPVGTQDDFFKYLRVWREELLSQSY